MKELKLTRGYTALVDDNDYERFRNYPWYADVRKDGRVYAQTRIKGVITYLHQLVMADELDRTNISNPYVDHINHNGLDNQKLNLRVVSNSVNQHNRRKPAKGVTFHIGQQKYMARISVEGKRIHLGYFSDQDEAENVYKEARQKILDGANAERIGIL